jgi:hypothetical protein
MKYIVSSLLALSVMGTAGLALADNPAEAGYVSPNEYHPVMVDAPSRYPFKVGFLFDLSVPSGAALGLQARLPEVPWFKLGLAGTYTLAPGIRGSLLIDPIRFPVAPVANIDYGHQFQFAVPGVSGKPGADFDYVDLQAGLAFGGRDSARFMLLAGESYLNGTVRNVQGAIKDSNGLTFANPLFHGWVPDAKLGFEFLF